MKITLLGALAFAPLLATAQVKCTMPNGVVITQQLSATCPSGAVKGVGFDGRHIALLPPPIKETKAVVAKTPSLPPAAASAPPPPPQADNSYELARAICTLLEGAGATTCEVKSNIFSTSTIEATLATTPADAAQSCRFIATSMRSKTNAFQAKEWKLLIFSPFSGNRPIAACQL